MVDYSSLFLIIYANDIMLGFEFFDIQLRLRLRGKAHFRQFFNSAVLVVFPNVYVITNLLPCLRFVRNDDENIQHDFLSVEIDRAVGTI